eukprot:GILJ01001728.1.p1 GENE.GILJ01001728.1~~GILJ01001728.1.p1  ORF type:complete len:613 (-),score=87.26 GILJ01001728.1:2044-3882(-)
MGNLNLFVCVRVCACTCVVCGMHRPSQSLPEFVEDKNWIEYLDDATGRPYFYHSITGETSWTKPAPIPKRRPPPPPPPPREPDFEEFIDDGTGRSYYYNAKTQETTWEQPLHFKPVNRHISYSTSAVPDPATLESIAESTRSMSLAADDRSKQPKTNRVASNIQFCVTGGCDEPSDPNLHGYCLRHFFLSQRPGSVSTMNRVSSQSMSKSHYTLSLRFIPPDLAQDIHLFQSKDFAHTFFKLKRGFFKKARPVESLLSFQNTPISAPLSLNLGDKFKKAAVNVFRDILTYMGDAVGKGAKTCGADSLAASIVNLGIGTPELRDEIYSQLVKQTTDHPHISAAVYGWILLSLCCASFPPTHAVETFVEAHLAKQENSPEQTIRTLALHAARKLRETLKKHVERPLRREEVERIKRIAEFPLSVFGCSLEEVMFRSQEYSLQHKKIPHILMKLIETVERTGGLTTEGLFRVAADAERMAEVRRHLETGSYAVLESISDSHIPANLLKLWLRELEEPLIPFDMYSQCIRTANKTSTDLKSIMVLLPDLNRSVLVYLFRFLSRVAENQSINKMGAENLAVVFSPNILRNGSDDPSLMLKNAESEKLFVKQLIQLYS